MDSTIRKLEPESLSEVNGGGRFSAYNVSYLPILLCGGWPVPPLDGWGYPIVDPSEVFGGKGVFNKAVGAVKRLKEGGIQPSILVTLTKYNFPVLSEHLGFLEKLGITSVTLQDLKPFGSREVYDKTRLTIQQEITLLKTFKNMLIKRDYFFVYPSELFIFFKKNVNGKIMQCPAGDKSAYIDFHGDLYPCTTLSSFKMGSLLGDVSLSEFYTNDLFGLPSRCPKALGFGNFSKKPKIHNENHLSLYTKDLKADKAEFSQNKVSKRF